MIASSEAATPSTFNRCTASGKRQQAARASLRPNTAICAPLISGLESGTRADRTSTMSQPALPSTEDRLDSWKDIAVYLKRDISTVQRWEQREKMPVHRHQHDRRGSVYAFRSELDVWLETRRTRLKQDAERRALDGVGTFAPASAMRSLARLHWMACGGHDRTGSRVNRLPLRFEPRRDHAANDSIRRGVAAPEPVRRLWPGLLRRRHDRSADRTPVEHAGRPCDLANVRHAVQAFQPIASRNRENAARRCGRRGLRGALRAPGPSARS